MARASRRRGKSSSADHSLIFIVGGVIIAILLFMVVFGPKLGIGFGDDENKVQGKPFPVAAYCSKGSAAVSRNTFSFAATVDSVQTKGKARLVKVRTEDGNKSLPLFVPADAKLKNNINENSSYMFTVKGCNGTLSDGEEVKGVLIITAAEPK